MIKKLFLILIILTVSVSVFSDEREDNIDIFILLINHFQWKIILKKLKVYKQFYNR